MNPTVPRFMDGNFIYGVHIPNDAKNYISFTKNQVKSKKPGSLPNDVSRIFTNWHPPSRPKGPSINNVIIFQKRGDQGFKTKFQKALSKVRKVNNHNEVLQCYQFKVHIFWEGHKILQNLHLTFDCHYTGQKYKGEDFANKTEQGLRAYCPKIYYLRNGRKPL